MDEKWVLYSNVRRRRSWYSKGQEPKSSSKEQLLKKKVMISVGWDCPDKNECTGNPCGAQGACNNTPGSYTCVCNAGYVYSGTTCVDKNECTGNPCGAQGACTNTQGSYTCTCNGGFELSGTTCVDTNECTGNPCGPQGACTNTPGSYTCACIAGIEEDAIAIFPQ
ncbi:adhesion G protein-coupled receptor E2-like [Octopus sinensis]|uniref:Adhesion G protein-coupled receptor E2-like n=1 Tax=Octopus sinensis TaxID=2607531 RepID=A0A7E6ELY8_9MOLL|nr:adhesion G protein-coupled receptor E2-like [Octopus sinensis]